MPLTSRIRALGFILFAFHGSADAQVLVGSGGVGGPPLVVDRRIRQPNGQLGTFYAEPTANVMGSESVRGGYSPLGMFGPTTLALYGPLSINRVKSAPVVTYQRGYDGIVRPLMGISFSNPNFPAASPVVYPTTANYYGHFPTSGVPPNWRNANTWLDQD